MQDIFYSHEQYREYQDALAGDGYRNEFERCVAAQMFERPSRNDTPEAHRLALAGKAVVMHGWTRLCNVTDAVIGEETTIVKVCHTLAEAEALIAEIAHDDDSDSWTYLYRLPAPEPAPAPRQAESEEEDDIPF